MVTALRKQVLNVSFQHTLELGGKSANIIFDDANLDQVVEGAQLGILFNQGEVCSAGSRLLVQSSIYDKVMTKLKEVENIKVGDPFDEDVKMSAQTGPEQLEKLKARKNCRRRFKCKYLNRWS